jgi:hypothetical protein
VARRTYAACCVVGVAGLTVFAYAPDARYAVVGSLLVGGITRPVIRAVGEIWVNRRTTSDVRATVHSFLSQAEQVGEIVFGVPLAALAQLATVTVSLMGAAALLAGAGLVVASAPRSPAVPRWSSEVRR